MKFYSTRDSEHRASFREAVQRGLAPDGGLYMPAQIPALPDHFFYDLSNLSLPEIGMEVLQPFIADEIKSSVLQEILKEALNFDIPVVQVSDNIQALELFHGPTLAFKDVGARFLARILGHFQKDANDELTILAATSGDTGSAVAHGFLGVEGTRAVILYPSGKVSELQEKQFTTLGQNTLAIEVNGTFDDCQALVKQALSDKSLKREGNYTSANSINIARLLPQMIYYFHACAQLNCVARPLTIAVPGGNFGNLFAGLVASKMGLCVKQFIAATNSNSVVPEYLDSGKFEPRSSQQTIANAMDVGNPSNFERILELFGNDHRRICGAMNGYSCEDSKIKETIAQVFLDNDYILDPHSAVAYHALQKHLKQHGGNGLILSTAHPAKFKEVVEEVIQQPLKLPKALEEVKNKEKYSVKIEPRFESLKEVLKEVQV